MNLREALSELRKLEKKKFDQTVDVIVNLRGVDPKRDNVSTIITLPHIIKEKKVCAFLTNKNDKIKTITQAEFTKYKDKKDLKKLVKDYDFFVAEAKLMPSIATNFGKVLGPAGKMPSPQLGVLMSVDDNSIKNILDKISRAVKIRVKELSFKTSIGKESMKDDQIIENVESVYNGLVNALPTKKENVKNIMIKLSMSKPIKVEMK